MKSLHSCNKTGPPAVSIRHTGVYLKLLVVLLKASGADPQGDPANAANRYSTHFLDIIRQIA
jgi:hypothetical protein